MTSSFASNQSNKQTRVRSQEASYYGQHSRPPSQGIFKIIDTERSIKGRCGTSLFLFSNKWLIEQSLVYLPLFEGAWTVITFNLCCRLGCSHARDKSDENHVGTLTGCHFFKKINLRSCSKDVSNTHPRFYREA